MPPKKKNSLNNNSAARLPATTYLSYHSTPNTNFSKVNPLNISPSGSNLPSVSLFGKLPVTANRYPNQDQDRVSGQEKNISIPYSENPIAGITKPTYPDYSSTPNISPIKDVNTSCEGPTSTQNTSITESPAHDSVNRSTTTEGPPAGPPDTKPTFAYNLKSLPTSTSKLEPLMASDSVVAILEREIESGTYTLEIRERAPTILGGNVQGMHVTAHVVAVKGLIVAMKNIKDKEFVNREDIRGRRKKLYEFMESMAAIDPDRREEFYKGIATYYEAFYTHHRFKKTDIDKEISFLQSIQGIKTTKTLSEEETKQKLGNIVSTFNSIYNILNNKLIFDKLLAFVRLTMTFFNEVPDIIFEPNGLRPIASKADARKKYKDKIKAYKVCRYYEELERTAAVYLSELELSLGNNNNNNNVKIDYNSIANNMLALFSYIKLKDIKEVDKKHYYQSFLRVVSRHIYICISAFPNIGKYKEKFEKLFF